ncbi:MAG TPA: ABC transporter C-terminal domain-containing protein [Bacteroidota bacterium]|nr:ABC transporter C-terminal domain-containing protein [Bacteroidota bacterium]
MGEKTDLSAPTAEPAGGAAGGRERKRIEAEKRQKLYGELKPWKDRLAACEREISSLEARISELESNMAKSESYQNPGEAKSLALEYQAARPRLEKVYREWARCTEAIEKISH